MSKLNAIRTLLQKALMAFERISTDKALIEFDGDELEVGMEVHGIDEEGNSFNLEDGEYTAEDKTVYVIKEGKVDEIREASGVEEDETTGDDVQPEAETRDEEMASEEEGHEEAPESDPEPEKFEEEQPAEEPAEEADPRDERIANLEAEVARLEEELGAANAENEQLRERIAELENKPAADPATEEYEKVTAPVKTGNKRLDNLSRILNA